MAMENFVFDIVNRKIGRTIKRIYQLEEKQVIKKKKKIVLALSQALGLC